MKTIVVEPINTEQADEATKDSDIMFRDVQSLTITNQGTYDRAGCLLAVIKGRIKTLDTLRKSITKPLDTAKDNVMALFRAPLSRYEQAEGILKKAVMEYDDRQEKIRKEEEDRLAREAEKKRKDLNGKAEVARANGKEAQAEKYEEKANGIVAPTLAPTVQKPNGIQYRDKWTAEVTDLMALVKAIAEGKAPITFVEANMTTLRKAAEANKEALSYPGVIFSKSRIVASRANA